mgnify:FL=1
MASIEEIRSAPPVTGVLDGIFIKSDVKIKMNTIYQRLLYFFWLLVGFFCDNRFILYIPAGEIIFGFWVKSLGLGLTKISPGSGCGFQDVENRAENRWKMAKLGRNRKSA